MNKYYIVVLLTLAMLLTTPLLTLAEELPKPPTESREELYHDMFLSLLSSEIDKPILEYYSKLINEPPVVYSYMIDVISAERVYGYRSFRFYVTLEVHPVVGPHISVGKDRLKFDISAGKAELIEFMHLETHQLPEHWQHILLN
ncbi:DUF3888 domain-containing protein [Cytobacillus sp. Hm23]